MRRIFTIIFILFMTFPLTSTNGPVSPGQILKPVIIDGKKIRVPTYEEYVDDGNININTLVDINKKIDALKIATIVELNTREMMKNDSIKKELLNK